MLDPRAEYARRIAIHQQRIASKEAAHRKAGNAKVAVAVATVAVAILWLARHSFAIYWLLAPVALFAALAVLHERILRAKAQAEAAAAFYHKGIARMDDNWAGAGQTGERFRDAQHPYAEDLDLFGRGSLFELLSTARLPMGENFLARWLRVPSPAAEIVERQTVVAELRENLDLRESFAVTGPELRVRLDPDALVRWAEGEAEMPGPGLRTACVLLSLALLLTLILAGFTPFRWPLVLVLLLETLTYTRFHARAKDAIGRISGNAEGLILFSQVLARMEREPFPSPRLQRLTAELKSQGELASRAIRKLAGIVFWIDGSDSLMGRILDLPLLYTIQTALAAESWRRRCGRRMRLWLDTVGEMEALLSLSAYSFEHPQDPFPQFAAEDESQPLFQGDDLGHPLIPAARCVRNSVCLDAASRLLMISGSNMSGKSTFLRTIGVNAVLAHAGAPIRGRSLRLSPLLLGTRIRSTDSLLEGRSNFYTEILRIRQVFELTERPEPLLFLFDELLEGTNSKDRRIGAEGLLRALLARHTIGVVTTHDLALTEIVQPLGNIARNAHFQDFVEDGKMRFDYTLREGVVSRSNALELMRLIGLEV